MSKLYVVIDVGCNECGVGSEVVGSSTSKEEAEKLCNERSEETNCWRDGGQSIPEVFEVEL